jgi:HEPN domain-containing protein
VNRADFQQLADVRIAEAKQLLDNGMYDGAYYLAGYAVECALKACIAKLTNQYDFPPKVEDVRDCYTHRIATLVKSANLIVDRAAANAADSDLRANWDVVSNWNEASRYERNTEAEARELYEAITDPSHGVLPWLKSRW